MPMAPTKGGKIKGTRTAELSTALPGNLKRSETHARGMAIVKANSVLKTAMTSEFHKPST